MTDVTCRLRAVLSVVAAGVLLIPMSAAGAHAATGSAPTAATSTEGLIRLQILAFNDYHGHLEPDAAGTVDAQSAGGGQYLATALDQLRAGKRFSLTVAAGDLIGGSPALSGLFQDEPSVESLNAMELDVSGVGNHEFDDGVDELRRMQEGGCHPTVGCHFPDQPYSGADFMWLAANVVKQGTGETVLPPYWIKRIGGVKVGFIGMTLHDTDTLVSAASIKGYRFLDEVRTANRLVPELKAKGVETIVVLLHEGASQDPAPGDINGCRNITGPILEINSRLDPEIDAVVTGHTHEPYNCLLPGPDGRTRMVTSAYSHGRVVTELTLVIDRRTGEVRRRLSMAENHAVLQSQFGPDADVTAVIDRWKPLFEAAGDQAVGTITADILRGGTPPGDSRGEESAAANLIADAQVWATSFNGAQIAFMNPGGIRSDLTYAQSGSEGDGVVTYGEAFTFQPFGNELVTVPMTGAQIASVLREQCQPAGSSRPFLALGVSSGFTYTLSRTIADGTCTSVAVRDLMLDGKPLDPAATYQVTVNDYLADGGDNFATFADVAPALRRPGDIDREALIEYLAAFAPVAPPDTNRVTIVP